MQTTKLGMFGEHWYQTFKHDHLSKSEFVYRNKIRIMFNTCQQIHTDSSINDNSWSNMW